MRIWAHILVLSFALKAPAFASSGASFLNLGVGARPVGMGETFVAIANDATAIFWNPAGLARLTSKELSASYYNSIQSVSYESLAYAHPIKSLGTFGAGVNYLNLGDLDRRDKNDQSMGTFGASDMALSLSYALNLLPNPIEIPDDYFLRTENGRYKTRAHSGSNQKYYKRMTAGLNLKVIKQEIDSYSANAVAVDIGLLTPIRQTRLELGVVLQNLGTDLKLMNESYPLPIALKTGLSYHMASLPMILSGALSLPKDYAATYQLGAEYWAGPSFALRSGYVSLPQGDRNSLGAPNTGSDSALQRLSGLMFGAGFKLSQAQIDYAFVPMGDLGNSHRITLGMKFK